MAMRANGGDTGTHLALRNGGRASERAKCARRGPASHVGGVAAARRCPIIAVLSGGKAAGGLSCKGMERGAEEGSCCRRATPRRHLIPLRLGIDSD
jgi:hypothetical protein